MNSAPRVTAYIVGEALIDAVQTQSGDAEEFPGGSPANVALTLGRLGHDVALHTWLGQDARGRAIVDWLAQSHVALTAGSQDARKTPVAEAHIQEDGSARYVFDLEWDLHGVDEAWRNADVVHTGSIGAVLEPGGSKVRKLLSSAKPSATITYDPNARPMLMGSPEYARSIVESYVELADVVKVSDEDLEWLYPGQDIYEVAREWQSRGPALVVVTRGGSGAIGYAECGAVEISAPRVTVADTVGAGDSFMGALIHGLAQHDCLGKDGRDRLHSLDRSTLETVLNQCARVAAVTVSRPGANPPWLAEI